MSEVDYENQGSSDSFKEGVLRNAVSCPIIRDRFTKFEEVSKAIKLEGVKECGLILGIDYTISNHMQGKKTFEGKSLHDVSSNCNPYQQIICTFGETLESFDHDGMIPVFGFGDAKTKGEAVFSLKETGNCKGFNEVLNVYNAVTPTVEMSGPTNLAPLIKKAIEICKETKKYHILVIAADGQVTEDESMTREAIVEASNYPLSIVMVGVGDGPWELMQEFDDGLPQRKFDNFQFVNFHEVMSSNARNPQTALALHALMEIPDQYKAIRKLGLLKQGL